MATLNPGAADIGSVHVVVQEPEVSTAQPEVSIARPKVSIAQLEVSIAQPEVTATLNQTNLQGAPNSDSVIGQQPEAEVEPTETPPLFPVAA